MESDYPIVNGNQHRAKGFADTEIAIANFDATDQITTDQIITNGFYCYLDSVLLVFITARPRSTFMLIKDTS